MPCGKGKNKYDSRKEAKQAMNRRNRQIQRGGIYIMNVYYCDECDGWHLTSMTSKKYKLIQKHKE